VFPPLNNASAHVLSASLSRHLTLHSLSTLSAIETFFGHQDAITSVSALKPTAAVTAGTSDRTCRWWKVEEEVQLVLRSGGRSRTNAETPGNTTGAEVMFVEGSVDVVCVLDDSHFISGGNSGTLALWSTGKKKPIFTTPFAHGLDTDGHNLLPSTSAPAPRWVTAIAALRGTNIFASGSWDGSIRLWALDANLRSFTPAGTIPLQGFVNGLQILPTANPDVADLAAAVGREPRLGRWISTKGVPNGLFTAELVLEKEKAGADE
jgi:ribosomal RNA-processing protein 9